MSVPSTLMEPSVTDVNRRIILPIVDLPLPLSPMTDMTSPASTENDTSRTAWSVAPPNVPTR